MRFRLEIETLLRGERSKSLLVTTATAVDSCLNIMCEYPLKKAFHVLCYLQILFRETVVGCHVDMPVQDVFSLYDIKGRCYESTGRPCKQGNFGYATLLVPQPYRSQDEIRLTKKKKRVELTSYAF